MRLNGDLPVPTKRSATHEALLVAAKRVVARDGVAKLTLDSVAQEAGVSKGGVLYHFATKNALIAAMMESDIAHWETAVAACANAEIAAATDLPDAGRLIRAYVSAGVCVGEEERSESEEPEQGDMSHWFTQTADIRAGMIAALAGDHLLLNRFRQKFADWQAQFENDGIDTATATVVRLASDGLFFVDMLGLAPPKGELRAAVLARLHALATPEKTELLTESFREPEG